MHTYFLCQNLIYSADVPENKHYCLLILSQNSYNIYSFSNFMHDLPNIFEQNLIYSADVPENKFTAVITR